MIPFAPHRLALAPLLRQATEISASHDPRRLLADGGPDFTAFLLHHGLAPLWDQALSGPARTDAETDELCAHIRRETHLCVATYLRQSAALQDIDDHLAQRGIPYAAMKGGHIREVAYADPALRPATDIDLLVHIDDRLEVLRSLRAVGYLPDADPTTISHEIALRRDGVEIDLHWDILRPGRARPELAAAMLERRQRRTGFWGLDDTDEAFLLLVHPAFAKHVCGPGMTLLRIVDVFRWLRQRQVDWRALSKRLEANGMQTAAWLTLSWYTMLAGDALDVPDGFIASLRPGRLRAAYLSSWLTHDLPTRFQAAPNLTRFGLTPFLHDRPSDAWRAARHIWHARRMRSRDALLADHE